MSAINGSTFLQEGGTTLGKRQERIDVLPKHEKCMYHRHDLRKAEGSDKPEMCHICFFGAKTVGEIANHSREISVEECKACGNYESKYLEFPRMVADINYEEPKYYGNTLTPARIRLCEDNKTYFGIYLGNLPRYLSTELDPKTNELTVKTVTNAGIYVPAKKKIYFGDESWWSLIEPDDPVEDITDEDISGQWYVKMLKEISKEEQSET